MYNIQEVNSLLLTQTKILEDYSRTGTKYLNYLKNELCAEQNYQNEYLLQNENLKQVSYYLIVLFINFFS